MVLRVYSRHTPYSWGSRVVERAQPWLGTTVTIRVDGLPESQAHAAIDAAFKEVALVHRLMSFHDARSEVSKLNRLAFQESVRVHPFTIQVLECAAEISACSGGCFDVSIGGDLVRHGLLPATVPESLPLDGCWQDVQLLPGNRVRFQRPLWIDLGGIAKGFAVDRAIESLEKSGAEQAIVNAGGDLRVLGPRPELIGLALETTGETVPVIEVQNGSVASSSGHQNAQLHGGRWHGPHLHGRLRSETPTLRFVSVVAEQCMVADALTKTVMAEGCESGDVLQSFEAWGYFYDPMVGWRQVGRELLLG